jgi:hypothetical protein
MGAAVAAWGAGHVRDVTGSYRPAFVAAGICCLVAAAGVTRIRGRSTPTISLEPEAVPSVP